MIELIQYIGHTVNLALIFALVLVVARKESD